MLLLRACARGAALTVPALAGHPELLLQAERLDDLVKVLRHFNVGRVHLHHLMGMDVDVKLLVHRLNVPFDLTVHDYYAICPQVNLLPAPTGFTAASRTRVPATPASPNGLRTGRAISCHGGQSARGSSKRPTASSAQARMSCIG